MNAQIPASLDSLGDETPKEPNLRLSMGLCLHSHQAPPPHRPTQTADLLSSCEEEWPGRYQVLCECWL